MTVTTSVFIPRFHRTSNTLYGH